MLGSGGAALRTKLKALAQSPSEHVASMLAEPSKLVARSRLPAGAVKRIGDLDDEGQSDLGTDDDDRLDEETYDDADFYGILLKARHIFSLRSSSNPPAELLCFTNLASVCRSFWRVKWVAQPLLVSRKTNGNVRLMLVHPKAGRYVMMCMISLLTS